MKKDIHPDYKPVVFYDTSSEFKFLRCGATIFFLCMCKEKMIMGGCGIWLSNIIDKKVVQANELNQGNTSAEAGK